MGDFEFGRLQGPSNLFQAFKLEDQAAKVFRKWRQEEEGLEGDLVAFVQKEVQTNMKQLTGLIFFLVSELERVKSQMKMRQSRSVSEEETSNSESSSDESSSSEETSSSSESSSDSEDEPELKPKPKPLKRILKLPGDPPKPKRKVVLVVPEFTYSQEEMILRENRRRQTHMKAKEEREADRKKILEEMKKKMNQVREENLSWARKGGMSPRLGGSPKLGSSPMGCHPKNEGKRPTRARASPGQLSSSKSTTGGSLIEFRQAQTSSPTPQPNFVGFGSSASPPEKIGNSNALNLSPRRGKSAAHPPFFVKGKGARTHSFQDLPEPKPGGRPASNSVLSHSNSVLHSSNRQQLSNKTFDFSPPTETRQTKSPPARRPSPFSVRTSVGPMFGPILSKKNKSPDKISPDKHKKRNSRSSPREERG